MIHALALVLLGLAVLSALARVSETLALLVLYSPVLAFTGVVIHLVLQTPAR